jgi:hypothetical protein
MGPRVPYSPCLDLSCGGFQTTDADAVTVVFLKGNMQIALSVSATGVNADAVLAAAKKIAAGL